MRSIDIIGFAAALVFAGAAAMADTAPRRVVSMNLCTDQLAMLLADPEQILSLSYLSLDPRSSAMHRQARDFPHNQGQAEEIYLLEPDLILAGRFTGGPTVNMLRRLDQPVEIFMPAYSLDDVRARIDQMGRALGQQARAADMIARFDADLALLREDIQDRPLAALYYANGYTTGDQTLAGQILIAAGFENAIVRMGQTRGGTLPLEVLVMLEPEAIVTGSKYPGASRSEAILEHPVIQSLRTGREQGTVADSDWLCGTPYVLRAVAELVELRRRVEEAR